MDEVLVNGHKDKDVNLQPGDIIIVPALASKPDAPAPPSMRDFDCQVKPVANDGKPALRPNTIFAKAGEYEYTLSDGRKVPVTISNLGANVPVN